MDDYISKPVDERLLHTKIGLFLARSTTPEYRERAPADEKFIDLQYLSRRTKSDPGLMTEMIGLYLGQTTSLIKQMMEAAKNNDWQALHAIAHKLIPSFPIVGINSKYEEIARKLQEQTRTGIERKEIQDSVLILEKVLTRACEELDIELDTIKNTDS